MKNLKWQGGGLLCALIVASAGAAQEGSSISAVVSAQEQAELSARRAGVILDLAASLGQAVEAGQVLVRFDCALEEARIGAAQVALEGAQVEVRLQQNLLSRGAGGSALVQRAKQELGQAGAQLKVAQAEAQGCTIAAPFEGVVAAVSARAFETVAPGTPILTVLNPNSVELDIVLPATWTRDIVEGTRFTFVSDVTKTSHEAKITQLAPFVDPASQTVAAKAVFVNMQQYPRSGSSGVARFDGSVREN